MLYGLWGMLVGAGLWNDPLAWAYILPASIFLFLFCRQEPRYPANLALLVGFIVSIMPVGIYNLTAPASQSTFALFGFLLQKGQGWSLYSIVEKIAGATLVSLPLATGANAVCVLYQHQAWPLQQLSPYVLRCTVAHGMWGLVIIALWLATLVSAIRAMHKPWYRRQRLKGREKQYCVLREW